MLGYLRISARGDHVETNVAKKNTKKKRTYTPDKNKNKESIIKKTFHTCESPHVVTTLKPMYPRAFNKTTELAGTEMPC